MNVAVLPGASSQAGGPAIVDPLERGSLPLASVAFPTLRPDEQRLLIEYGDRITLDDARAFLHSEGVHWELRSGFGTGEQRTRLRRALDHFERQLGRWTRGHRQSPRIDWLVRHEEDQESQLWALYVALLARHDYVTFTRLHELLRLPNAPRWTPFLSADSIRLARSVKWGHRTRLERAFEAAAASLGLDAATRPWSAEQPLMDALPTSWLYQFQPSQELGALIELGCRAGLCNVGHFAVLDPAVTALASSTTVRAVVTRASPPVTGGSWTAAR